MTYDIFLLSGFCMDNRVLAVADKITTALDFSALKDPDESCLPYRKFVIKTLWSQAVDPVYHAVWENVDFTGLVICDENYDRQEHPELMYLMKDRKKIHASVYPLRTDKPNIFFMGLSENHEVTERGLDVSGVKGMFHFLSATAEACGIQDHSLDELQGADTPEIELDGLIQKIMRIRKDDTGLHDELNDIRYSLKKTEKQPMLCFI